PGPTEGGEEGGGEVGAGGWVAGADGANPGAREDSRGSTLRRTLRRSTRRGPSRRGRRKSTSPTIARPMPGRGREDKRGRALCPSAPNNCLWGTLISMPAKKGPLTKGTTPSTSPTFSKCRAYAR